MSTIHGPAERSVGGVTADSCGSVADGLPGGNRDGIRRREFLAAVAAGLALVGRAGKAMADSTAGSVIWGIGDTYRLDSNFAAYCEQLETDFGRRFAGFRLSGGFSRQSADFTEMHRMINAGRRWTYVNGKPSGTVSGYWQATAAGQYDAALNQFIQRVLNDPSWNASQP